MIPSWRFRRLLLRAICLAAILALLTASVLDYAGVFGFRGDDWARYDRQRVTIVRAIESDVLEVQTSMGLNQVQLAGLEGPKLPNDHYSLQSFEYTSNRTADKPAILRLEALQPRDSNGRLIAHVYLLDTDNLNADIVKDGIVYADRRSKHSMKGQYEQLENEARQKKRGLWKSIKFQDMPAWRQQWLNKRAKK